MEMYQYLAYSRFSGKFRGFNSWFITSRFERPFIKGLCSLFTLPLFQHSWHFVTKIHFRHYSWQRIVINESFDDSKIDSWHESLRSWGSNFTSDFSNNFKKGWLPLQRIPTYVLPLKAWFSSLSMFWSLISKLFPITSVVLACIFIKI